MQSTSSATSPLPVTHAAAIQHAPLDLKEAEKRLTLHLRQMLRALEIYKQSLAQAPAALNASASAQPQPANNLSAVWDKAMQPSLKSAEEGLFQLEAMLAQKRYLKDLPPHQAGRLASDHLDFEADFIHIKPDGEKDEHDQLTLCQLLEHQKKYAEAAAAWKVLAEKLMKNNRNALALRCMKNSYRLVTPSAFSPDHHTLYGMLLMKQGFVKLEQRLYQCAYSHLEEAELYLKKSEGTHAQELNRIKLEMAKLKMKHEQISKAFTETLQQIRHHFSDYTESTEVVLFYSEDIHTATWVQDRFGKDLTTAGFDIKRSANRPRSFDNPPSHLSHNDPLTVLIYSLDFGSHYIDSAYSDPFLHQLRSDDTTLNKINSQRELKAKLFDFAILMETNSEVPIPKFMANIGATIDFSKTDEYFEQTFLLMKSMLRINDAGREAQVYDQFKANFVRQYQEILDREITDAQAADQIRLEGENKAIAEPVSAETIARFFQKLLAS